MASEKVEIQFIADSQGAEAAAKRIDKSLNDVGVSAKEVSGKFDQLTSFISSRFVITAGDIANFGAKVGSAIAGGFAALPGLISQGAGIDDLVGSFDALATKAGVVSETFINDLSKSLGDTIPKVDLMKKANELLLGGLKPDQIELVAKAARTFGEVTGTNAVQGMDAFGDSLLRGNDRALKTLGIVLDNDAAIQEYANKAGKAKDQLTELEKTEAIRNETLKLLAENTDKLGEVTDDSGDIIEQISTAITNQKNAALQAIGTNQDLQAALVSIRDVVREIDFAPFIAGLTNVISFAANAASAVNNFVNSTSLIDRAVAKTTGEYKVLDDQLGKVVETLSIGTPEAFKKAAIQYDDLVKVINETNVDPSVGAALAKDMGFVKQQIEAVTKVTTVLAKTELPKLVTTTGSASKSTKDLGKEANDTKNFIDKYKAALEKQSDELAQVVQKSDEYKIVLGKLKDGELTTKQAGDQLKDIYTDKKIKLDELKIATQVYNGLLLALSKGSNVAAEDLAKAASEVENLSNEIDAAGKSAKESGNLLDGLLDGVLSSSGGDTGGAEAAGKAIGQAALNGLLSAISGDKLSKEETGAAIGEGIGAGIGAYFGDPATGAALGKITGQFLSTAFGSRNAQGAIRDSLDKSFAEALEKKPLQINIDGSGIRLTDLNFLKDTDAFSTGAFDDFFLTLDATAQQSFQGLALGFSNAFGQGSELASQLSAVLATNLGGNLNNLQLLVDSMGLSFEELESQVVKAFESGAISALEAQSALQGIAKVAEKGIPDGIGLVKTAFDNIAAAGVKGGATLVDALKDVGYEAKELGDKTLEQVMQRLKNTAGVSADEVDKVFAALNKAGITTLDQLTSATTKGLLPALADLQNQKFPFAEAAKDAQSYLDAINKIPEQKDVQLNLKINYPNSADQKVVQDLAGRGQLGQGVATR